MSACYLDTNFLYVHLRTPVTDTPEPVASWRAEILEQLSSGTGVISALVLDELAYRLILAWLRDDGEQDPLSVYRADEQAAMRATRSRLARTWRAVDALALTLQPTDQTVVEQAKTLMARPALGPRDAFHAAHALTAGCSLIASSDPAFERVRGLRPIGP